MRTAADVNFFLAQGQPDTHLSICISPQCLWQPAFIKTLTINNADVSNREHAIIKHHQGKKLNKNNVTDARGVRKDSKTLCKVNFYNSSCFSTEFESILSFISGWCFILQ